MGSSLNQDFRYGSLRALRPEDADKMLEWMHLPETKNYFQFDFSNSNEESVLQFIEESLNDESCLHLAITGHDDAYLGTISLKNIVEGLDAEYAISMTPDAKGTGAAKAGTEDLLEYAFKDLGLHRIYLNVRSDNSRAIGFYEKMGFIYEGRSRDALKTPDGYVDLLWFSVLSNEWDDIKNDDSSRSESEVREDG